MTNAKKNKPEAVLRDGSVKATIWRNPSEKGFFYSIDISRTYKEGVTFLSSYSFSGTDILKVQQLSGVAYNHIQKLLERDAEQAKSEEGKA